jgi:hypothetical protein
MFFPQGERVWGVKGAPPPWFYKLRDCKAWRKFTRGEEGDAKQKGEGALRQQVGRPENMPA